MRPPPIAIWGSGNAYEQAAIGCIHPRRQSRIGAGNVGTPLTQEVRKGDGQLAGTDQVRRDVGKMAAEALFLSLKAIGRCAEQTRAAPG
jgi:hypothetical protein